MNETNWYKFTEHNDHEGETWHFFVKLTTEEFWHITNLIESDEEFYLSDSFSISEKIYEDAVIDVLVAESDEGYMPTYNKTYRPYASEILELTAEAADMAWYKGAFWN